MWLDFLCKIKIKIKSLVTFLCINAIKHSCTEAANLEVDILLCWPTLVQLECISLITNFKCCMQRERTKKSQKLNAKFHPISAGAVGSCRERCLAEALHPAVMTTASLTHQALAIYTKRKQLSTSKNHTNKGRSGIPSHTHCRECRNPTCKSKADSPCLRIHILAENTKARRWPISSGLHCKIFARFYQWSNINPFSVLTRLPYFLYSKSKDA